MIALDELAELFCFHVEVEWLSYVWRRERGSWDIMQDKVGGLCDCCHCYRGELGNVWRTFHVILLNPSPSPFPSPLSPFPSPSPPPSPPLPYPPPPIPLPPPPSPPLSPSPPPNALINDSPLIEGFGGMQDFTVIRITLMLQEMISLYAPIVGLRLCTVYTSRVIRCFFFREGMKSMPDAIS